MTAPALPGAAPDPAPGRNDPARLPEDVEKAIQAHAYAAAQWPTGAAVLRFASNRLRAAILAAMRAATAGSGAASAASAGSAAHIAPPVAPTVEAALAALDVEAVDRKDSGVTVHEIVGLDDVRAAHRAEVARAVAAEREACANVCDDVARKLDSNGYMAYGAEKCIAAIRARGGEVVKPYSDSEIQSINRSLEDGIEPQRGGIDPYDLPRWLATVDRLAARVAKLEAALTYYADLDTHGARLDAYESNYTGDPSDIELDRGEKARAALEAKS